MDRKETMPCPNCDANILIDRVRDVDIVTCTGCSREFRLVYRPQDQAWHMVPIEPVEGSEEPVEHKGDKPFEVLKEPGGPRDDDLDKL